MTVHLFLLAAALAACGVAAAVAVAGAMTAVRLPATGGGGPNRTPLAATAPWAAALPLALLLAAMALRGFGTGRAPLANLHEVMVALAAAVLGIHLAWTRHITGMTVAASGVAAALVAVSLGLPVPREPLVPALQAPLLLPVHVGSAVLAYAATTVASLAAAGELIVRRLGPQRAARLASAARFRAVTHRAVLLAVPLLAAAIALGSVWANVAWRSYWSNDPKELSAAATWLLLAAYLHVVGRGDRWGRGAPWLALAALGGVLFTLIGASLLFGGQHSYAQV